MTAVRFVWLTGLSGHSCEGGRVSELPSGTVTFLFTDIAGSTRLWQDHPERMRAALARHDALLRAAIEARGGYVVKTTGDGFHAAFAAAPDAIDAAIAGQCALAEQEWGEPGPLLVRMGVHTCEAESRAGDYFGSGVNRAARLMGVAHGGQVVVSLATSALVPRRVVRAPRPRRAPPPRPCPGGAPVPGRRARPRVRVPAAAIPRRLPRQPPGTDDVVRGASARRREGHRTCCRRHAWSP